MSQTTALGRAWLLIDIGRFTEAAGIAAQCIATDPDDIEAWRVLAQCQASLGQGQAALDSAHQLVRLSTGRRPKPRVSREGVARAGPS